jgi:hypothetical protein
MKSNGKSGASIARKVGVESKNTNFDKTYIREVKYLIITKLEKIYIHKETVNDRCTAGRTLW